MAAHYLLDTNVIIAAVDGHPASLLNRLAGLAQERLCLSPIVLAELLTGAEKSRTPEHNRAKVLLATHGMELLPFGAADADACAKIRAGLEKKGTPIGPYDLQIAAQALVRDLVLVTANLREFRRVPGLSCENWLK